MVEEKIFLNPAFVTAFIPEPPQLAPNFQSQYHLGLTVNG
jgi:hypothetical protein